jgi:hypothetical protein
VYALSPFPLAADGAEFAFAGREVRAEQRQANAGWREALKCSPTQWERFRLVRA